MKFTSHQIHITASNIVVTMYTTYHFGTILESNSYLQNMLIPLSLSFCAMHPPLLMVMLNYR